MFILRLPSNTAEMSCFFSSVTITQQRKSHSHPKTKKRIHFFKFNAEYDFNQRSSSVVVWVIRHSNEAISLLPLPLSSKNVLAARPVAIRLDVFCGEALKYLTETLP